MRAFLTKTTSRRISCHHGVHPPRRTSAMCTFKLSQALIFLRTLWTIVSFWLRFTTKPACCDFFFNQVIFLTNWPKQLVSSQFGCGTHGDKRKHDRTCYLIWLTFVTNDPNDPTTPLRPTPPERSYGKRDPVAVLGIAAKC